MSVTGLEEEKPNNTGANIFVIAAIVIFSAMLIGGYLWLRRQPSQDRKITKAKLENAIRPGSPEWKQYAEKIVLDAPEAVEANRTVGGLWMQLQTTARNFTGRTITGLEMKGMVVDLEGKPVNERTIVIIPGPVNNQDVTELENNKVLRVPITLEGFKPIDVRANIKMEVTGFRLQ